MLNANTTTEKAKVLSAKMGPLLKTQENTKTNKAEVLIAKKEKHHNQQRLRC